MTSFTLDRSVRRPSAGIVIGGSPLRLFRLTPAGADVFDRITAGADVPTDGDARPRTRQLVAS